MFYVPQHFQKHNFLPNLKHSNKTKTAVSEIDTIPFRLCKNSWVHLKKNASKMKNQNFSSKTAFYPIVITNISERMIENVGIFPHFFQEK